jgi:hypothetical protein
MTSSFLMALNEESHTCMDCLYSFVLVQTFCNEDKTPRRRKVCRSLPRDGLYARGLCKQSLRKLNIIAKQFTCRNMSCTRTKDESRYRLRELEVPIVLKLFIHRKFSCASKNYENKQGMTELKIIMQDVYMNKIFLYCKQFKKITQLHITFEDHTTEQNMFPFEPH